MAVSALKTIAKGLDDPSAAAKAAKAVTATGRSVDLSKGFKVRGLDGTLIPFRPDTPLEKAKEWTKNFYRKDFDFVLAKADEAKPGATPLSVVRDKKDPGNVIQFYDYGHTYQIQTAKIGEAYRGKGIGAGMYRTLFEKAKSRGVTVTSDSRLTESSFAIWQRFKALGYPIKERPYKKIGDHYELADKDLMKTPEEQGGIFEYDPLAGDVPNLLKRQAGEAPGDEAVEATGALTKKQAE